jgi:hypothetical protein
LNEELVSCLDNCLSTGHQIFLLRCNNEVSKFKALGLTRTSFSDQDNVHVMDLGLNEEVVDLVKFPVRMFFETFSAFLRGSIRVSALSITLVS